MKNYGHKHHHCDDPWEGATPREIETREMLRHIIANQEIMMSKADELKAAIDDLATEMADNNAAIEKELTRIVAPGTSDADVDAAVTRIRSLISDNKAEVDKLKAIPA